MTRLTNDNTITITHEMNENKNLGMTYTLKQWITHPKLYTLTKCIQSIITYTIYLSIFC